MNDSVEFWNNQALKLADWEASCWSEYGQTQRMLAAVRYLELRPEESVLDYGCGPGKLTEFLPDFVRYFGYDLSPGMLERARFNHGGPTRTFHLDPDGLYDHIVIIGTFNLCDFVELAFDEIAWIWETKTKKTLVASLYSGSDPETTFFDPEEVAKLAEKISSRWLIDRTYLDNDLMLVLRKH